MSVTSGSGQELATWDGGDDVGLEDIGAGDVVIPRLRIEHTQGVFVEKNSGWESNTLDCILLGLIKQRIYWRGDIEEGDRPACKSPDFNRGFPNLDERTPADKRFPVRESNFDLSQFPPTAENNGHVALPCSACVFAQWQTKDGKNIAPPCAEQHTYPLLYTPDNGENWLTALLTFQKTGIRPSRQYLSTFAQTKQPMFTVRTQIRLDVLKRGNVTYSVPKFKKGDQTDQTQWGGFAESYRGIREFVRAAPRPTEDSESTSNPATEDPWAGDSAPAQPARAATAAPVAAPAPDPTPEAVAPPAVAAAAPAATPAPASTPATATPPAEEPAPAQPAAGIAPDDDDDGLPF